MTAFNLSHPDHTATQAIPSELSLTPDLRKQLTDAARHPLSEQKLALQVVAQKARVWAADDDGQACRPWYMLILELYPRGKVINHQVHRPASTAPSASALLSFFLQHVSSPPSPTTPVRPTHVSFVDPNVTLSAKPHLEKLAIIVDTLTLADGVSEYMRIFADKLVQSDRATRSDAAERPGLLTNPSVTSDLITKLMSRAVAMHQIHPWTRIPEYIALRVTLPLQSGYICKGSNVDNKLTVYVSVLGGEGSVMGFAAVPSLATLRLKFRRVLAGRGKASLDLNADDADDTDVLGFGRIVPTDICLCAACGAPVASESTTEQGQTGHWAWRCAQCRFVHYCNRDCQRDDWKRRHRAECHRLLEADNEGSTHNYSDQVQASRTKLMQARQEIAQARKEWGWIYRELALLYMDPTAVPFDDLDHFDTYIWPFVSSTSPPLYPLPFVSVQDSTSFSSRRDLPSHNEIHALTLIANALCQFTSAPSMDGSVHLEGGVVISVAENLAEAV